MKPKSFHFEAYTISETARKLSYKSTKTIYRLLNRDLLEDYVYLERSGRVYLILEPPNNSIYVNYSYPGNFNPNKSTPKTSPYGNKFSSPTVSSGYKSKPSCQDSSIVIADICGY